MLHTLRPEEHQQGYVVCPVFNFNGFSMPPGHPIAAVRFIDLFGKATVLTRHGKTGFRMHRSQLNRLDGLSEGFQAIGIPEFSLEHLAEGHLYTLDIWIGPEKDVVNIKRD